MNIAVSVNHVTNLNDLFIQLSQFGIIQQLARGI